MPVIARYACATMPPLLMIAAAPTLWGGFAILALVWLTVIAAGLDHLLTPPKRDADDHTPWSDLLSLGLGLAHVAILPVVLMAIASPALGPGAKIALFLATASAFGQISHPNAHELIHRRPLWLRALGALVYTSVGFGHHVSAHRLVHHRFVGTPDDPNTPQPGESFWRYLPRAWLGSFRAGLARERDRLARRRGAARFKTPYLLWVGGACVMLAIAAELAGLTGVLTLVGLGLLTGTQILLSDYIQHYGLRRISLPNGRVEPVAPHHSWNAPKGFSSYLMLNAPAHSEHHMHPDTPYDRLDPEAPVPTLPYSMPIMAMLATLPPVWRRIMDKRAAKIMAQADAQRASVAPVAAQ